jgi:hypothetical protein
VDDSLPHQLVEFNNPTKSPIFFTIYLKRNVWIEISLTLTTTITRHTQQLLRLNSSHVYERMVFGFLCADKDK